jgi:hypothetical protein
VKWKACQRGSRRINLAYDCGPNCRPNCEALWAIPDGDTDGLDCTQETTQTHLVPLLMLVLVRVDQ